MWYQDFDQPCLGISFSISVWMEGEEEKVNLSRFRFPVSEIVLYPLSTPLEVQTAVTQPRFLGHPLKTVLSPREDLQLMGDADLH